MTGKHDNDQDLDNYLEGKDGISREYQSASPELPPRHLDEAILASSRKSVGAKPGRVSAPFSGRWHVPVSIAAIVVLSVLVVFNLPNDQAVLQVESALEPDARTTSQNRVEEGAGQEAVSGDDPQAVNEAFRMFGGTTAPQLVPPEPAVMPEIPAIEMGTAMDLAQPLLSSPATDNREDSAAYMSDQDAASASAMRRQAMEAESRSYTGVTDNAVQQTQPAMEFNDEIAADLRTGNTDESPVSSAEMTECTLPRPEICTMEYMPVCGIRDTGIPCVTTPCDSTERVEYPNACNACGDPEVIGYVLGQCDATLE